MAKPLQSDNTQPQNNQFKHFGVLDSGEQSKTSLFTSVTVNLLLALIIVIIGAAAKKTIDNRKKEVMLVVPLAEKPPEPIRPKIIPPKIIPPKMPPKLPEPKIVMPEVKPIVPPTPQPVAQPKPLPVVTPAPPKVVVAAAAPKPTTVNLGQSASVVNHDQHPSAVALGQTNNPIAVSNRPATSAVNLGNSGMAGMPPGSGRGPASSAVNLGSGQPNGSLAGGGARAVQGVKLGATNGVPGGVGNGIGTRPAQVALGQTPPPPPTPTAQIQRAVVRQGPQVTFKPRPVYTAEATAMHLEGTVSVRIRVASSGAVSVVGVTSGLGHGLDESAIRAIQGTRFRPAVDASGNPTDWEGVVNISFQLAS